jgi:hypothetical protein
MLAAFALSSVDVMPAVGSPVCPCLQNVTRLTPPNATDARFAAFAAAATDVSYGVGCHVHDRHIPACEPKIPLSPFKMYAADSLSSSPFCQDVVPRPSWCDAAEPTPPWCGHAWCYVDPLQCQVANAHSLIFAESVRYYSYASCGYPDAFTSEVVRSGLRGSILRVYYHHDSGGYIGAYHPGREDNIRDDQWHGPYVDLIQQVARAAGFVINITVIPQCTPH